MKPRVNTSIVIVIAMEAWTVPNAIVLITRSLIRVQILEILKRSVSHVRTVGNAIVALADALCAVTLEL